MDERDIQKLNPFLRKNLIRLPLFIFPWIAGIFSGITTSLLKMFIEMLKAQELITFLSSPLPYICITLVIINVYY